MATITESLAEIKTIGKRVAKKQQAIKQHVARAEAFKDPLAQEGGSVAFIAKERQAIKDLQERIIELRRGIAKANAETVVALNGDSRSIADWLTWRREVAPTQQQGLAELRGLIEGARKEAQNRGMNVVSAAMAVAQVGEARPQDLLVNISEVDLATEIEKLEDILGTLDGLLSLKNATTQI